MHEANKYQVGGNHYKSAYEHWDWVVRTGQGYHEAVATKYITRWRKPTGQGLKDLQKTFHYLTKTIELAPLLWSEQLYGDSQVVVEIMRENGRFFTANELNEQERDACELIVFWPMRGVHNLHRARDIVRALMEQVDAAAAPVPLEDSNKHADRVDYANMPSHEMLAALADNGAEWAAAFCQTAKKLGIKGIDEGWMIGWFANAIERSWQVRSERRAGVDLSLIHI